MDLQRRVLMLPSQQQQQQQQHSSVESAAPLHNSVIYILTFKRNPPEPYHWVFLIQPRGDIQLLPATIHQLCGVPGDFYYQAEESAPALEKLGQAINKVEVGSVRTSNVPLVVRVLREILIVRDKNSRWGSQDWTTTGLASLRGMKLFDK